MQGFFVLANTAGTMSSDFNVQTHSGSANWLKNSGTNQGGLSAVIESESGMGFDEVQLEFGFPENLAGAKKLFSHVNQAPGLFMPSAGEFLSVRYMTSPAENPVVPLMFKPGHNGFYTLRFNFESDDFETIFLEDCLTHTLQNLKTRSTYRFQADITDDLSRFKLHFGPNQNTSDHELPANIYTTQNQLVIDLSLVPNTTEMLVYDAIGRLIMQQNLKGESEHKIPLYTNSQILIVYLANQKGTICRKLSYNNSL
jgi:hypothetical protein